MDDRLTGYLTAFPLPLKVDAYKASLLEGNRGAKAPNNATVWCANTFVRDLQPFFGENDDYLKRRITG